MIILNIETALTTCSVALSKDNNCIFYKENSQGMNHAALLSVFIQEAIDFLKTTQEKISAVAVSSGPGSYTGLRIGVSTAKGLCYALDIPLIAVNTLEIIAKKVIDNSNYTENILFCPMIDARRMEVYTALFSRQLDYIEPISSTIIDENSFSEILETRKIVFFGNGAAKCKDIISNENAVFIDGIDACAEKMIYFSQKAFEQKKFEDVAYFEPFYLKEFQATIPKNKVIAPQNADKQ
ncbi:MAG: tRNA (adenosine(37)-N6)-threonylcarbamoyltransferase complex dimerization subunit type 1 TsaB [Paludibacter sp.]|jgi:tRNA threonylcarbamoyladenosine biosynthesis protein TsaB|nr:tRNA (adenosine(37)-N6)-threonylcarbamoyltransferase complex dimerization subunit type 1 TsaB [Paludibacter sp.]